MWVKSKLYLKISQSVMKTQNPNFFTWNVRFTHNSAQVSSAFTLSCIHSCNGLLSHLINLLKAITASSVPRRIYLLLASFHSHLSEDGNCYWIIRPFAHVSLGMWDACIVCLITVSIVKKAQSNTSLFFANSSLWQLFTSKALVLNNWLFNLKLGKQNA